MRFLFSVVVLFCLYAAYKCGLLTELLVAGKDAAVTQLSAAVTSTGEAAQSGAESSGNWFSGPARQSQVPASFYTNDSAKALLDRVYSDASPGWFGKDTPEKSAIRSRASQVYYQLNAGEVDAGYAAAEAMNMESLLNALEKQAQPKAQRSH